MPMCDLEVHISKSLASYSPIITLLGKVGVGEVFSKLLYDGWSFILNNARLQGLFHRAIDLLNCSKENDIGG